MAGSPLKRARVQEAQQQAGNATARLEAMRAALIRDGIDPNRYDDASEECEAPLLVTEYTPAITREVYRLARQGLSPTEIRVQIGYTETMEEAWNGRYVEFGAALTRARELYRAFWDQQVRQAAQAGDTGALRGAIALIEKTILTGGQRGDASKLVRVTTAPKLVAAE